MRLFQIFIGATALVAVAMMSGAVAEDDDEDSLLSTEEMFEWILELDEIGVESYAGWRQAGTTADEETVEFLVEELSKAGIEDIFLDPVPVILSETKGVSLKLGDTAGAPTIPATYMGYTEGTGPEGVSGELHYVGRGMDPAEFAGAEGKIVVVDLWAPGLPYDTFFDPFDVYTHDPDNTMPGAKVTQNWPVFNFRRPDFVPYQHAVNTGAVGMIAILDFDLGDSDFYWTPYDHVVRDMPGVYISKSSGTRLKEQIAAGPVSANIEVEARNILSMTNNVIATIPGRTDEIILVTTHIDGWASNDASGTAVMLALAKYFANSSTQLDRTLLFMFAAGHFAGDEATKQFIANNTELIDRVVVQIGVEHIAKEYIQVDGKLQASGQVSPRVFFLSGATAFQANTILTSVTHSATINNDLRRTIGLPAAGPLGADPPGLSRWYHEHGGIPVVHFISGPAIMFTPMDTPDTIAKEELRPVAKALVEIIHGLDPVDAALLRQ